LPAQEALFSAAFDRGLRVASGLVVSDRRLLPSLEVPAPQAVELSRELMERWHGRGLIRYAVTPRFSVSCSDELLAVCGELAGALDGVLVTTHMNETRGEVSLVGELFPWARDYLETYERFGLVGERSVFAHNVHAGDDELARLAAAGAAVAHCPSSNSFLGSGMFPLGRHLEAGVKVALGTDVGAGASLSMLGEGLMAYDVQMLKGPERVLLSPAHLLWLATGAGASALGLADEVGDLTPGKSADFVLVRPAEGSTLRAVLEGCSLVDSLGALFTLAREDAIAEVRVAGEVVFSSGASGASGMGG
jgi:guanine deaminase